MSVFKWSTRRAVGVETHEPVAVVDDIVIEILCFHLFGDELPNGIFQGLGGFFAGNLQIGEKLPVIALHEGAIRQVGIYRVLLFLFRFAAVVLQDEHEMLPGILVEFVLHERDADEKMGFRRIPVIGEVVLKILDSPFFIVVLQHDVPLVQRGVIVCADEQQLVDELKGLVYLVKPAVHVHKAGINLLLVRRTAVRQLVGLEQLLQCLLRFAERIQASGVEEVGRFTGGILLDILRIQFVCLLVVLLLEVAIGFQQQSLRVMLVYGQGEVGRLFCLWVVLAHEICLAQRIPCVKVVRVAVQQCVQ